VSRCPTFGRIAVFVKQETDVRECSGVVTVSSAKLCGSGAGFVMMSELWSCGPWLHILGTALGVLGCRRRRSGASRAG